MSATATESAQPPLSEPTHPAAADAAPGTAATRLVLFVGAAVRPDDAMVAALARGGMRSLHLGGPEQAVRASRWAVFDAAVVDASVATASASPALLELRVVLNCPLLVVAGHADEVDEIVALELGADAYLVQPLAPRRLSAHLRALLRRHAAAPAADPGNQAPACFDDWQLDRLSGMLIGHGRRIELTDVQSRLMQVLMDAAGLAVPRTALMAALPRSTTLASRSVDVYISRLRQRLEHEGVQRLRVHMVRGCGYALQGLHALAQGMQPCAAPRQRHQAQPELA